MELEIGQNGKKYFHIAETFKLNSKYKFRCRIVIGIDDKKIYVRALQLLGKDCTSLEIVEGRDLMNKEVNLIGVL